MTLRPKRPTDLTLAPVAAEIDLNLQPIRDLEPTELVDAITLAVNANPGTTRDTRAKQVVGTAVRGVELHGWTAEISDDATRLQLRGGSVALDVGLSARMRDYIEG